MSEEIKQSRLGSTAYWTAAVRAMESKRTDRLFKDPWAVALAGTEGSSWIEHRTADSVLPIVLRTRFFDDFLLRIATDKAIRQIVLMGAGLDTRAFRLSWPQQMRFFELDQGPVLEYKERILQSADVNPTCTRQIITCNLISSWKEALIKAGFNQHQPSGWLFEGFLFYLSTKDLTHLLDRALNLAVPGSYIGFDIINAITLTHPLTQAWVKMQAASGAPWIGTMDDPKEFLSTRGWKAKLTPLGAPEATYNRWPYPVNSDTKPGMPQLWYVTGEKV